MARGEPERPGPPLPAPYRNPWSGLAEALRAVVADRRLALQRLWRRNRDGELPLPAFWPLDLAPLFWPLLLSAVLALLLGLGGWLLTRAEARSSPSAAAGDSVSDVQLSASRQEESWLGPALAPQDGSAAREGLEAGPGPSSAVLADDKDEAGEASRTEAATAELRLDPLLELLGQGEDAGLLLAARPDPAASRLSLTLSPAAETLPQAALLARAQRWQQRAREAGYERLELRDAQGRLRGRGALVGSGMILLAPLPAA